MGLVLCSPPLFSFSRLAPPQMLRLEVYDTPPPPPARPNTVRALSYAAAIFIRGLFACSDSIFTQFVCPPPPSAHLVIFFAAPPPSAEAPSGRGGLHGKACVGLASRSGRLWLSRSPSFAHPFFCLFLSCGAASCPSSTWRSESRSSTEKGARSTRSLGRFSSFALLFLFPLFDREFAFLSQLYV